MLWAIGMYCQDILANFPAPVNQPAKPKIPSTSTNAPHIMATRPRDVSGPWPLILAMWRSLIPGE